MLSQRDLWLSIGVVVATIAWWLTHVITHVDHTPGATVTVAFDERPSFQFERVPLAFSALQRERQRFDEAALTGRSQVVFFVTPATRAIAISGIHPGDVSCGALKQEDADEAALLAGTARDTDRTPVSVGTSGAGVSVVVPARLRRDLASKPGTRGAIACTFRRRVASEPTFTERALTVRATTGRGGAVLVDISALEDVDDLRFSGGLQAPLGGDRTRLLYGGDNVVSLEWADVMAQEQRDIVLVLIGALSAVAAASIIEGIRPVVERRPKK
jgi:hypothetical protein